ncbi:MAG: DUF362 domain-containing protein [Lentisphaeria bacterium]|nr:DUF362 domain-containing protein [Lentisphaeria bacterium]
MPSTRVAIVQQPDYSGTVLTAVKKAIDLAGGLSGIISPGDTVLIKPNLLSPRPPEEAVTTHPEVVRAVVECVREAGAKRVWIGDSCAGAHSDEILWNKTGMRQVAESTGAILKSFHKAVKPRPVAGQPVPVPAWLDEVDTVISLPKMKTHALTGLTCAMKNTYGLISGAAKSAYHASHPSPRSMSTFLVDVYIALKPDFFIVDCIEALEGEGPANGAPKAVGLILAGADGVAIDTVCARMLKGGPKQVPMLAMAAALNAGTADVESIECVGDGVDQLERARLRPSIGRHLLAIPEWLFKPVTRLLACHPKINQSLCVKCGICADICSQNAISGNSRDGYRVNGKTCIMCMCCSESCPKEALAARSPLAFFGRIGGFFKKKPPDSADKL